MQTIPASSSSKSLKASDKIAQGLAVLRQALRRGDI